MYLTRLGLRDFRSFLDVEVPLEPGVTVLVGLNGQGKTNFAEAVGYLANQRSHRVAKDIPLVRRDCERALLSGRVRWQDREIPIDLEINAKGTNRARVAGAARRPREALGILRTVLFAPEDLTLVKGDPSARRSFCDELLVSQTPRIAGVQADYERVVRQRSALLRSSSRRGRRPDEAASSTLAAWDEQLVTLGAQLAVARIQLVDSIREPLANAYEAIAPGQGPLTIDYQPSWLEPGEERPDEAAVANALRLTLAERAADEWQRGVTLVGPHRDDLALGLSGLPVKGYASHGESWSVALALRLASFTLLRDGLATGGDPVLILDDVFAELDQRRRRRLADLVHPAEQVLVTAAVPEDVPEQLQGRSLQVTREEWTMIR